MYVLYMYICTCVAVYVCHYSHWESGTPDRDLVSLARRLRYVCLGVPIACSWVVGTILVLLPPSAQQGIAAFSRLTFQVL